MGIKLHETVNRDGSHYSWLFFCPGCDSIHQCDTRWSYNGDPAHPTFRNSVLVHAEPSIGRPLCHSYVTDGRIQYLGDCTHALAGKTVDLPDWDTCPRYNGTGP
jgi:hypothetical protein